MLEIQELEIVMEFLEFYYYIIEDKFSCIFNWKIIKLLKQSQLVVFYIIFGYFFYNNRYFS